MIIHGDVERVVREVAEHGMSALEAAEALMIEWDSGEAEAIAGKVYVRGLFARLRNLVGEREVYSVPTPRGREYRTFAAMTAGQARWFAEQQRKRARAHFASSMRASRAARLMEAVVAVMAERESLRAANG